LEKPSSVYIRHATRAKKQTIKLDVAQDKALVWADCVGLMILDKGTGSFTLTIVYPDKSELELNQDEVLNGDTFLWDMAEIRITNTAQAGLTVKLLVDQVVL